MPFVFLLLGLLLFVVAVRGTHGDFFTLLKSEFSGVNSFVVWAMAFILIGAIGFWKPARPVAVSFMGLIFLVLILKQGTGFFDKFQSAIKNPVSPAIAGNGAAAYNPGGVQGQTPVPVTPVPGLTPSQQDSPAARIYRQLTNPRTFQTGP